MKPYIFPLTALLAALGASGAAQATPVTAIFDLTSPTAQIVALAGQTAIFTADTGIKFSAYGGVKPSLGSGILPANVETAPGGAGVAGDSIVASEEYFNFFGPSKSDGTPLAGRWTAFTATGDANTADAFNIELRKQQDINDGPQFFLINPQDFLIPQRFTMDLDKDLTWVFTLTSNLTSAFTIRSLEYTYDDGTTTPPPSVPEPGTFALFGIGLAGALGARRKKAARVAL